MPKKVVNALTALDVERILRGDINPKTGKPYKPMNCDGMGLWLNGGAKAASWIYRYMSPVHRRSRDMGLGSAETVKLKKARELRDKNAAIVADGVDPLDAEHAASKAAATPAPRDMTFREATDGWLAKLLPELSNPKYARQVERQLRTYAFPTLADVPVRLITMQMVLAVLQPEWVTKNPTMTKVRGYIEAVLDWCTEERPGPNPAVWRGNLSRKLSQPKKVHRKTPHAAVDWRQMPAFMVDLRSRRSTSAKLLEFTILTASRTAESLYAKVGEVNEVERAWTVPAERMKGEKNERTDHRVPLSDRAFEIYREMAADKGPRDFLFSHDDGEHLSTGAMDKMMELIGVQATPHGTARSSFSTWRFEDKATAKEFDQELVEASLHHRLGSEVMLSYQRGKGFERRQELMQAWSDYLAGPRAGGEHKNLDAGNVVSLTTRQNNFA